MRFWLTLLSLFWALGASAAEMVFIDPAQIEGAEAYQDLKPFWIDQTEVTVGELIKFRQATKFKRTPKYQARFPKEKNGPAPLADWFEAAQFCRHQGKRLPSQRQWELAAGPSRTYAWGDEEPNGQLANLCDSLCKAPWHLWRLTDGFERQAPVGSFPQGATAQGALDMTGNLWEWTRTRAEGGELEFLGEDQPREDFYVEMVIKGGSYGSRPEQLKNQAVATSPASFRASHLGFRCVKEE